MSGKNLFTTLMIFIFAFSILGVVTNATEDFSFKEYIKSLSDMPSPPDVPSVDMPDDAGFWDSVTGYFKFLINLVIFPIKFIAYYIVLVLELTGGLVSW